MPERLIQAVTVDPPPIDWAGMVAEAERARRDDAAEMLGRTIEDWVAISRSELLDEVEVGERLPTVIATGHQAGFWHAGILAKYLTMEAAGLVIADANGTEVQTLELVVDQDVNDALVLPVPSIGGEKIAIEVVDLASGSAPEQVEGPLGFRRVVQVTPESDSTGLMQGFAGITRALGDAKFGATNLAEQFANANRALRDEVFGAPRLPRTVVLASRLTQSTIWDALVDAMRSAPRDCAEAYNAAVLANPGSGIGLLEISAVGIELPLWKVIEGQGGLKRERVFAEDLVDGSEMTLLPRALLMTGLVRLVLADLFIHGLGGESYERVTEGWFRRWLGVELMPMAVVSADVYLDFGLAADTTTQDVSDARWDLQHLKYNLDRVPGVEASAALAEKLAILAEIESYPRRSGERYAAYLRLQAMNERLRVEHTAVLDGARQEILQRKQAVAQRDILTDRTWAFPLLGCDVLLALRARLTREFGSAAILNEAPGMVETRRVEATEMCGACQN